MAHHCYSVDGGAHFRLAVCRVGQHSIHERERPEPRRVDADEVRHLGIGIRVHAGIERERASAPILPPDGGVDVP